MPSPSDMKQTLGLICLVLLNNWAAGSAIKTYECLPGAIGICILDNVFYNGGRDTTYVFPKNYTHFRIGSEMWSKGIDSVIPDFDADLYQALGEPQSLEIVNSEMKTLQIPRELVFGNFGDNRLQSFWIEPGSTEPKLKYLDLSRLYTTNLTNITSFVNLETLYLFSSSMTTLETSVFQNLTKLRYLNLHYNSIERIVGDQLPQSLTYLGLYYNDLVTLNYSSLRLASLETLTIQRNRLESINTSALIQAMPKLKVIRLGRNLFNRDTLLTIIEDLRLHNITYTDEKPCYSGDEVVGGVCMDEQLMKTGWVKATLLSLLTVVLAIVFGLVAWWILAAMNK